MQVWDPKTLGKLIKWCPNIFLAQREIGNTTHNAFMHLKTYIYLYVKESRFLDILHNGYFWCHICVLYTILCMWVCFEPYWSTISIKAQRIWNSKSWKWSFAMAWVKFSWDKCYINLTKHYKDYGKAINWEMVYRTQENSETLEISICGVKRCYLQVLMNSSWFKRSIWV